MRIIHLIPGSGGTFYCQNCLRDAALVKALRAMGHDVIMVPLYLPLLIDAPVTQHAPTFFGGINTYLQQYVSFFRKTPRWLDRFLDAAWLLRRVAVKEGSTNAADLGPMTLSMMKGRGGFQRKEFERFLAWIQHQEKPDVIHISNALLLGLAPEIRSVTDARICCGLQDEEPWVDGMPAPYNRLCWEAMSAHAACVDRFVATSEWYAERMRVRLGLPQDQVRVVYLGADLSDAAPADRAPDPPVLGYLSHLSEAQGFSTLVDAFIRLKRDPALRGLRLRATGGLTQADTAFVNQQRVKLRAAGMEQDVEILSDFTAVKRHEFLKSLSVLSVPVHEEEAFGLYIIEALAYGVPVVQPRLGAFPELLARTGGGILFEPGNDAEYDAALRALLLDPARARSLAAEGRARVLEGFSVERMAEDTLRIYNEVLAR
jgi:glycosyltransferase involved in cell wall biosynthesis